jgi:hypothetical protein
MLLASRFVLLLLLGAMTWATGRAFLPPQNPRWSPTYNMRRSTLCMIANFSGLTNASFAGAFGIVSFDWSNDKANWVLSQPMTCEESMLRQAIETKKSSPETRVFVYRNLVKALPWFSSVRKKLDDSQYSGFFLPFKAKGPYHVPPCTTQNNRTKCSVFYHDQEQTPEVPSRQFPNPDGSCNLTCDCGRFPCGEYLFDHRNGSLLTDFLVNEYVISQTAVGSPVIDGLFIDDFWCADAINGSCSDPVQGPSEIDRNSQADMGLSDSDVAAITGGWLSNMEAVQQAVVNAGGFTWSLFPGQANANAMPNVVTHSTCAATVAVACSPSNPYATVPLLQGLTNLGQDTTQQVAAFLLMRGPYAYIGWGEWGMEWPFDVPLPAEVWDADYGDPLDGHCEEQASGVFVRRYTKANVTLDCNSWKATLAISTARNGDA